MDYAGINARNLRFPVNRRLTEAERKEQLDPTRSTGVAPRIGLSLVKFNSTYIELVDRWYPVKGFNVWLSVMGALAFAPTSLYLLINLIILGEPFREDERWILWCFWIVIVPASIFIIGGIVWLFRSECFRWTHYPMRVDRRSRQIHFFRQDGTVATGAWDRLFFLIGESTTPPIGKTNDLRVHILSEDGATVTDTFSLGYEYLGERQDLLGIWEFIRQYMQGSEDDLAALCAMAPIYMPVHDRKEGFVFGVIRTFATFARFPLLQLVFSFPYSFIAMGRWLAMATSQVPRWPAEIEAASMVGDQDRCRRDWRDDPPLGFMDKTWPLICTAVGMLTATWILYVIEQALALRA